MTELIAWIAVFAVVAGIVYLALAVVTNPKWLRDKPYKDQHGELIPCGCKGCER